MVAGAVSVVSAEAEDDAIAVKRQASALEQRGGRRTWGVDDLGELDLAGHGVEPDQLVGRVLIDELVRNDEHLGAGAASTTGVPVIPTVGEMSPQGKADEGTGVPRWALQATSPVAADSVTPCRSRMRRRRPVPGEGLAVDLTVQVPRGPGPRRQVDRRHRRSRPSP